MAPEWGSSHEAANNTAIDIYAFGVCALETAALELVPGNVHPPSSSVGSNGAKEGTGDKTSNSMQQGGANGTNGNHSAADSEGGVVFVTEESIQKTIDCLEDEMQKDFIRKCLRKTPEDRPTARELLFHPVLFEVHSLKLLAAHILVNTPGNLFLLLLFDFKRNLYRESVVFELSSLILFLPSSWPKQKWIQVSHIVFLAWYIIVIHKLSLLLNLFLATTVDITYLLYCYVTF